MQKSKSTSAERGEKEVLGSDKYTMKFVISRPVTNVGEWSRCGGRFSGRFQSKTHQGLLCADKMPQKT